MFALEQERVFGRTWQLAGHAADVGESGQYFTTEVAGESVVVLRDGDVLRGFHNVCLHRAGPVASGCGKRQTLQCKYHGWTYRLDGSLLRTPGMEDARHFRPEEMHLVPVRVEAWGPLIFVNLDLKAPPIARVPRGSARSGQLRSRASVTQASIAASTTWPATGRCTSTTTSRAITFPLVHPALHKELDDEHYQVEPRRYYSIQHAPLRGAAAAGPGPVVPSGRGATTRRSTTGCSRT